MRHLVVLKNITANSLTGDSRFNYDVNDTLYNDLIKLSIEDAEDFESAKVTLIENALLFSFDDGYGNLNARYSLEFNVDGNSFYDAFFGYIISTEEGTLE